MTAILKQNSGFKIENSSVVMFAAILRIFVNIVYRKIDIIVATRML